MYSEHGRSKVAEVTLTSQVIKIATRSESC
jgi:hypothetical protein